MISFIGLIAGLSTLNSEFWDGGGTGLDGGGILPLNRGEGVLPLDWGRGVPHSPHI